MWELAKVPDSYLRSQISLRCLNLAEERAEEEAVTTGHSPRGVAEDKHSIVKGHANVVLLMTN